MASLVLTDAFFSVNSVDLSHYVRSLTLNYEAEMLDDTTMGTSGTRSNIAGLKNWNIDAEFLQNFDAGAVDATLFSLVGAPPFPIVVRPTSAAMSVTNPEYTGQAVLETYPPLAGEVGALSMVTASFRSGGGSPLVRSTGALVARSPEQDEKQALEGEYPEQPIRGNPVYPGQLPGQRPVVRPRR